jgi:hypothetical protein
MVNNAAAAGVRVAEYVTTNRSSPWDAFQRVYELKLDEFITVATREDLPCDIVMVEQFTGASAHY